MLEKYSDLCIEHWCSNILCTESTNDPDNSDGCRYVLDGDQTLRREECCIECKGPLISRLDVIRLELLKELNICQE